MIEYVRRLGGTLRRTDYGDYRMRLDGAEYMTTLESGTKYDVKAVTFVGWTVGDGTSTDGYHAEDYFGVDGAYLGADEHGIEPMFEVPREH